MVKHSMSLGDGADFKLKGCPMGLVHFAINAQNSIARLAVTAWLLTATGPFQAGIACGKIGKHPPEKLLVANWV